MVGADLRMSFELSPLTVSLTFDHFFVADGERLFQVGAAALYDLPPPTSFLHPYAGAGMSVTGFAIPEEAGVEDHRAAALDALDDDLRSSEPGPFELASRHEAVRLLERFLGRLSDSTRPVFILAELEQMTAPAIAETLSLNLNTVYSRLRLARQAFEREVAEWTRRGGRS